MIVPSTQIFDYPSLRAWKKVNSHKKNHLKLDRFQLSIRNCGQLVYKTLENNRYSDSIPRKL